MATRPATSDEAVVQLATRVPRSLLLRVKIYCVERDQTVMTFIEAAVREKLRATRIQP